MPNTLIPIQTYTLSSATASVTFSNIPQNYTDLKIVVSARNSGSSTPDLWIRMNGLTSGYSARFLSGSGGSAGSGTRSVSAWAVGVVGSSSTTSSTFTNQEVYIPNYAASITKSVSSDSVQEDNATTAYMYMFANFQSSTAAVTSLTCLLEDSTSFLSGSTFTLYGISNGVKATGGTLTVAGGYAYHTFTSTGAFLPNQRIKGAEVLCIAGGGAGSGNSGGGGGAGGLRYVASQSFNAGQSYTALVGAGGAGAAGSNNLRGNSGSNSVLGSVSATGGGGGGNRGGGSPIGNGASGGSGGGGSVDGYVGGAGNAGGYSPVEGYAGGDSLGSTNPGGGGGGAGGLGQTGGSGNTSGGDGGIGSSAYSSWHAITATGVLSGGVYYIAGGGGGSYNTAGTGEGGLGGGGANGGGNNTNGAAATANTGGGGGAATGVSSATGGSGGSGLIIIRYPVS